MGDEVWLLNVEGNKTELFWLRKPDYEFGMEDRVAGGNLEIIARAADRRCRKQDEDEGAAVAFFGGLLRLRGGLLLKGSERGFLSDDLRSYLHTNSQFRTVGDGRPEIRLFRDGFHRFKIYCGKLCGK